MNFYCNPVNINYRYQFIEDDKTDGVCVNREAADPTMISYQNRYYIFASMTLGVWVSDDMVHWENHRLPAELPLYDYAPDARVIGDWVYLSASASSKNCNFYRTRDILHGPYEEVSGTFPFWDPNLFCDTDGRVYFYWGCSNSEPIYGVEVNPETMEPMGKPVGVIAGDPTEKGFERVGEDNGYYNEATYSSAPYIEGAWMDKIGDKYYLQYAAPGTEFNTYCNGVYVGDSPLGPFTLARNNPYSYKPGGFLTGAGHGSTMEDRYGNLWHTATMRISTTHMFERRVGIWPAGIDGDGELFCNQRYGDWPRPVTAGKMDPWANPEWMLLSYGKKVTASSEMEGHGPALVTDEDGRTCWKAASNGAEEWIELDLGDVCDVHAIQINFADHDLRVALPQPIHKTDAPRYIEERDLTTRWVLEGGETRESYEVLVDKSDVKTDLSHDLVLLEEGTQLRYLRLRNIALPYGQNPCVSGIRVFGRADCPLPQQAQATAVMNGPLDMEVTMHAEGAVGYNVLWGHHGEKLYHSYLTYEEHCHIGGLVRGETYYMRVDSFNEGGITEGIVCPVRIEN